MSPVVRMRVRSLLLAATALVLVAAAAVLFARTSQPQPTPPTCQDLAVFGARLEAGVCVVAGNLTIERYTNTTGPRYPHEHLPDRLTIDGNLTVNGDALTDLPTGLSVHGSIMLYKTSIEHLPPDLRVDGDVDTQHGWGSGTLPCRNVPKTASIGGRVRCDP